MVAPTEHRTERWVLKCRSCKHIITRDVQVTVTVHPGTYYLGSYRSGTSVTRVDGANFSYPRVVCPMCSDYHRDGERAIMVAKRIEGHHNPAVRCDSRCTHAKGSDCECSCGGANHGADYAG